MFEETLGSSVVSLQASCLTVARQTVRPMADDNGKGTTHEKEHHVVCRLGDVTRYGDAGDGRALVSRRKR